MPGYEHILAVADEDDWIAHGNAIFDIAWLNSEPQLLTASGDQTAVLWNVEPVVKIATFEGHSCSLKSISCRSDDKFVFSTCARDGNIMIWDTRCNKRDTHYTPVNIIHSAHVNVASTTPKQRKKVRLCNTKPASDSQQSVTAVVFQDENTLISAGAMDGSIKMWDLRKNYKRMNKEPMPKHVFPYAGSSARKRGFSNLLLNSTRSCVFASCTDDIIYQYDCAGLCTSPVARYTGHLNSTFYVKAALSSDDNYLLSGSSDDTAYIWQVRDALFIILFQSNKSSL
uniref:Denticleless protein homolog n=1 Tax=Saccoglossus kowalevskii TaxID=10224 RepID=A0ABM0GSW6_SACKO|nr:PREDICTED: denticleless protein homolog [Saccoglossus kowalevskii]